MMKCTHCGYESPNEFVKCPSCGNDISPASPPSQTAQAAGSYYPYVIYPPASLPKQRTTGEKVAIGIAIAVSILSVIAGFIIFFAAASTNNAEISEAETFTEDEVRDFLDEYKKYSSDYGIDDYGFDDFDLDQFFEDYYGSLTDEADTEHDGETSYGWFSPAEKGTPVTYVEDTLNDMGKSIEATYDVTLEETYRGDAALKLMNLQSFDELAESEYYKGFELFVVKYRVDVKDVTYKGDVSYHVDKTNLTAVIAPTNDSAGSEDGALSYHKVAANYQGETEPVKIGDSVIRWSAFIVEKDNAHPYLMWSDKTDIYHRNAEDSVTDAAKVTAGEAAA